MGGGQGQTGTVVSVNVMHMYSVACIAVATVQPLNPLPAFSHV